MGINGSGEFDAVLVPAAKLSWSQSSPLSHPVFDFIQPMKNSSAIT